MDFSRWASRGISRYLEREQRVKFIYHPCLPFDDLRDGLRAVYTEISMRTVVFIIILCLPFDHSSAGQIPESPALL